MKPITLVSAQAFKGFSIPAAPAILSVRTVTQLKLDPVKLAAAWAERAAVEALYAKHNLFGYGRA